MGEILKRPDTGEFCEHGNIPSTCQACFESQEGSVETLETKAQIILDTMGLKWEDLEGKSVLEIGAGLAELAQAAKERGIAVVSLEKEPEMWKEDGEIPDNVEYVVGDANEMPFEDASLDLIISKAAPPSISSTKAEVKQVIGEAVRVLKDGGIFRFGPGYLNAAIFEGSLFTDAERESLTIEQRMQRIREESLKYLQSLHPSVREVQSDDSEEIHGGFVYELKK